MRLAIPSLILISYITFSLILWMPGRPWMRIAAVLLLCIIGFKYIFYEKIGGSFIAPAFPPALQLVMEVCYSAMIILVFLLVIKDILAVLLFISRWFGSTYSLPFSPGIRGGLLITAALVLSLYGTWQALKVPRVHTVEVAVPRLPESLDGFTIAQLTDLHVGPLLKRPWVQNVVNITNGLGADLVVLTGDIIDGYPQALADDIEPFKALKAKYGVFGITGNHEYYFNGRKWTAALDALGITMLENDYRSFFVNGETLVLAGVPDERSFRYGEPGPDLAFMKTLPENSIRVLLKHRPSSLAANDGIDLQLSGHTHGGHLFFLKWLIASHNGGLVGGLFDFNGPKLYVSPGTGVWPGFLCRLGVPSEITKLVLRRG